MPRRKRTSDEGGRRAKVSRVEHNEEPVVISDSDHDEEDENKRSSRTERWKRRENKSHIQDMTEEEMVALAVSLSTQEANTAAHRQQLEDKDIQKAIEESLNESTVKASAGSEDEAGSSSDQPQENVGNPTSNLRRKLSYLSQDQTHSENERETTSPLPEMPDLSQTASSHRSSRSSFQISGPPAITETSSDKKTVISDTPEDELFKSQSSLVFTSHSCLILQPVVSVEKLSQDFISASTDLNVHTQDSTVTSTYADRSRFSELEDSPFSKCITQNNFHRGIDSLEDKDDHKNVNGNEDETQIPDEDTHLPTKLSQELSTDPDTCLSRSRKSQLSSPKCVPEDKADDATVTSKIPDVKQAEDQTTQGENAESNTENAPKTQSWNEFTSHMVVHLADDDDDDEDDGSQEVLSPSPVLIKKKIFRPVKTEISPTHSSVSSSTITLNRSTQDTQFSRSVLEPDSRASKGTESKPSDSKHPHTPEYKGERTIAYYWGVPFCPVGQNPDEYTRVIMCQMEVYEKTLKEAQRELLRKADWGQPVFPGSSERSFGVRRWKRHRAPRLSEDEEENEEAEEKENNPIEVEEEREETKEESVVESQEDAVGEQSETYVVLSSPETKDEQLEKTPFFSQEEPVAPAASAKKPCRKNIPWDTSEETQIQCSTEQEEEKAQNHERFEDDETVCPETQLSEKSTPELMMTSPASPAQPQSRADSEVMEVEEGGDAPAAQEEMMEQEGEAEEASMECPMCSKLFPLGKIEMHAAYCDGEADHREEQSQVVARRKRTRRNVTEETSQSGKSTLMEKCFICEGFFSQQEYQGHVDLCCKKKNPRTNQKNGLLSALDWTEQRRAGSDEPGPSDVSTQSNCGRGDPVATESENCSATSSCPSSTFSPQSESTACLSESSKNSQRLSRKRKFKR